MHTFHLLLNYVLYRQTFTVRILNKDVTKSILNFTKVYNMSEYEMSARTIIECARKVRSESSTFAACCYLSMFLTVCSARGQ